MINLLRTSSIRIAVVSLASLASSVAVLAQTPTLADSIVDADTSVVEAETVPTPAAESTQASEGYKPLSSYLRFDDDLQRYDATLALTESSGTWLRRGLWYADIDAVVMQRTWNSDELTFAQEFDQVQTLVPGQVNQIQFTNLFQVQSAELGEASPGAEGMPRLALGRFLFRDAANRDHTTEIVVFGGGEWIDRQGIQATLLAPGDGLDNPVRNAQGLQTELDGDTVTNIDESEGLVSFDGSEAMEIEYQSRFHSWEWNYSVAQRMRKDRMELDPSGQWVRRASDGVSWDMLAGFRYFDLEEGVDWLATNIRSLDPDGNATNPANLETDGAYRVSASNNLFGGQLGLGLTYDSDRWNVTFFSKHGLYVNDGRITADVTYTDLPTGVDDPSFSRDNHENSVVYLLQGGITGRYHLRPNLSLRAGWEFLFVNNVALAPNQIDFNPAADRLDLTGDVFYHGITAGTEYYW